MSNPPAGGNPFEGMPIFADLARLFTAQGPLNWEVARQIAAWVATEGAPEGNVEPVERMRLAELGRVAELHVAEATGLPVNAGGRAVTVRAVGRREWALATLEAYTPLLERLATSLRAATTGLVETGDDDPERADPSGELLGDLTQIMSPLLLGMQAGFMVGYLGRRALSQYDLPIPRPASDDILVVAPNVAEFASDWSLPADDLRMWVCLDAICHHAVLGRPHVRERLTGLLGDYATGFRADPAALESRLADIDPQNPSSWERILGDPEWLLGAMVTDAQRQVLARIEAVAAAVAGYVDHVMDAVATRTVGSFAALAEAFRRRRVERGEGDRLVERLFGLELTQRLYDRGAAFVSGVVERAGEAGLAPLWASPRGLPTPAEIDAPGLWLARLELPDEDG